MSRIGLPSWISCPSCHPERQFEDLLVFDFVTTDPLFVGLDQFFRVTSGSLPRHGVEIDTFAFTIE
jgi:hypothetical protein